MSRARLFPAILLVCTLWIGACNYLGPWAYANRDDLEGSWNVAACVLCTLSRPILSAENMVRDAIARAGRCAIPDPRLVFLAVDNDSVSVSDEDSSFFDVPGASEKELRAYQLMKQGFPWPREIYGLILERLVKAGAKVVVMDLNFPTSTSGDAPFHAALDACGAHVVIGANFAATPRAHGRASTSLSRPAESIIPVTPALDSRIGIVNFWPDSDVDDIIRSAQYRLKLSQVTDAPPGADDQACASLSAQAVIKAGYADSVPAGFDRQPIRFSGGPGTYAPHSIYEIFAPEYWKRNYGNGEFFSGKIVAIGGYGNWQHDEHPTAFGIMPGPEVQLNAINALLHREFLRETPPWVDLLLVILGGVLPLVILKRNSSPWVRAGGGILVNLLWIGAAFELFNHASLIVPCAAPLAAFNINALCRIFQDALAARHEGKRVRRTLERYVSRNVVTQMLDHSKEFVDSLGGALKPATILFSDIRNFSTATARMDPQELVIQLNEYFSAMVECVFQYNGTLDKFIGDAVMAVWGNAHTQGPGADACAALRTADAMRERLDQLNRKWAAEGRPTFRIGIALNHGMVVSGNFGSPHRMEYSVIGDAVNVSWRLQELTKELGEDLVFGESVAELVQDQFLVEEVSLCTLPKTHQKVHVFKLAKPAPSPVPVMETEPMLAGAV